MTPEWHPVESKRITHEAHDPELERILVRFHDGVEWCYEACPPDVWRALHSAWAVSWSIHSSGA